MISKIKANQLTCFINCPKQKEPMNKISLLLFLFLAASLRGQDKPNVNTDPYPYGNPVITHMYTADAAPHVMPDGRVWMVTSVDHEDGGGYAMMQRYHIFSSGDMVEWTDHGEVLHIDDLNPERPDNQLWALWAPDMVYRNGYYYLYFPVRILFTDRTRPNGGRYVESYLGVARTKKLGDRFEVVRPRMEETRGIDPAVFVDDDGTPYLYWGSHMGATLQRDMLHLDSEPQKLEVGTDRFMEAVWMNKRDGKYFISYHTKYDWQKELSSDNIDDPERRRSELAWSVGDSPMGPFTYGGTLNYELGVNVGSGPKYPGEDFVPWRLTQSNHGGIVEFHGKEYLFYHTSALSSWRQDRFQERGTWTQRSVCVDVIVYDAEGRPLPVQQTLEGVDKVVVEQPYAIDLDPKEAIYSEPVERRGKRLRMTGPRNVIRFKDVDLGSGYYYFQLMAKRFTDGTRVEVRLDSDAGPLLGTVIVDQYSPGANEGLAETFLRGASGKHDVFLVVKQPDEESAFAVMEMRFIAGAPMPDGK